MLGFIEGKIISKSIETSQAVVLCAGVGYEITLSKQTLEMTHVNSNVSFWIHTHVREDALILFGFFSEAEKQLFRILIGVSGLGPKTALSLLSEHGPEKLIQLIVHKRISEIAEAPGVGKKLAERLSLELSTKLGKLAWIQAMPQSEMAESPKTPVKMNRFGKILVRLLQIWAIRSDKLKTLWIECFLEKIIPGSVLKLYFEWL
ncbi:Holliday junction branch migration protein RuvA [bacterium]|nr:Holliday junction branch migration protein RuvA [bacterium]